MLYIVRPIQKNRYAFCYTADCSRDACSQDTGSCDSKACNTFGGSCSRVACNIYN